MRHVAHRVASPAARHTMMTMKICQTNQVVPASCRSRLLLTLLALVTLALLSACSIPSPTTSATSSATSTSNITSETECRPVASDAATIPTIAIGATGEATQWRVHQLDLTATAEYANPYTDVIVTATFAGPNNLEMTMQGFWNGDNRFAVRFTPPAAGEWSYEISSEPADAGLTQSGAFTAAAAPPEERGFVRRDPQHPYHFVYDNGERHWMMGNTYYDLIRTACAGDRWQEGIVQSAAHGINKIRIFVHSLGFGQDHHHPDYYPATFAFLDDDHDRISIDYWNKMDEVVGYLAAHDTVADLIIFMRPYNIEDELAFGTQEQDERYLRYILARYAAFPNVIWCITNEWEYTERDEAYWDGMGEIVRNEDPWMTQATDAGNAHRALSIHHATGGRSGGIFRFFESDWPVHAIVQYGVRNARFENGDEWSNYSIVQNRGHAMPVGNDEYGYIGEMEPVELTRAQHRRALWGIGIAGGYASVGDFRVFYDGPDGAYAQVIMSGHWHDADEYDDIKRYVDFWTTQEIPYWRMEPQNERVVAGSNVYVLGAEDSDASTDDHAGYVVYAAIGGDITLDVPDGSYTVSRFDPRTGESTAMDDVTGGGAVSFTLPSGEDWVLRLTRS